MCCCIVRGRSWHARGKGIGVWRGPRLSAPSGLKQRDFVTRTARHPRPGAFWTTPSLHRECAETRRCQVKRTMWCPRARAWDVGARKPLHGPTSTSQEPRESWRALTGIPELLEGCADAVRRALRQGMRDLCLCVCDMQGWYPCDAAPACEDRQKCSGAPSLWRRRPSLPREFSRPSAAKRRLSKAPTLNALRPPHVRGRSRAASTPSRASSRR